MSQLDATARGHLLLEISNIFTDDTEPSLPTHDGSPFAYEPGRKRHDSVEEVLEGDPFADVGDGTDSLAEPKIELADVKEEPADDVEFNLDDANNEEEVVHPDFSLEKVKAEDDIDPEPYYTTGYLNDGKRRCRGRQNVMTYMCTICNSIFMEQCRLRLHMRRKHNLLRNTFRHICDVCGESYDQKNSLLVHMRRRHGPKAVKVEEEEAEETCNICGSILMGKRRLRFHMHRKHKISDTPFKYKCKSCPNTYDRSSSLLLHNRRKHSSKRIEFQEIDCPLCPKSFTSRGSYMTHIKRIHNSNVASKNAPGVKEQERSIPAAVSEGNNELICSQCPLLFADMNRLRLHMKRAHNYYSDTFQYKCSFCLLTYDKRASLIRHVTRKHNKELFCNTCKKQFTSTVMFLDHSHGNANIGDKTPVYQCELCKMIYLREGTLSKHMKTAHGLRPSETTVYCDVCRKSFYHEKYLINHQRKMHSDLSYTCQFCEKVFKSKPALRHHIFRLHLENVNQTAKTSFLCQRCGKSFSTETGLCNHIASAHTGEEEPNIKDEVKTTEDVEKEEEKPFEEGEVDLKSEDGRSGAEESNTKQLQCTECDERFDAWSKLRSHFKSKHLASGKNRRKAVCQHCGLTTTTGLLTRHMVIAHKDLVEIFNCKQCNYKTAKKHLLTKHQQSHTLEKKFSCPVEGCSFKTHDKYKMRPHSSTHAEKVRLYCEKCTFTTNDPHIMKNHENEHLTGRKRYTCDQCDYSTNLPASIITHRFKHSDERSFKCTECDFDTKYSTSLWLHKRQKHSDKPPLKYPKRPRKAKKE